MHEKNAITEEGTADAPSPSLLNCVLLQEGGKLLSECTSVSATDHSTKWWSELDIVLGERVPWVRGDVYVNDNAMEEFYQSNHIKVSSMSISELICKRFS